MQISIEKNNRIISDDFALSEEFSTFFEDAARLLNVKPDEYYRSDTGNLSNKVWRSLLGSLKTIQVFSYWAKYFCKQGLLFL